MAAITGAFALARALNAAFLIQWEDFVDQDADDYGRVKRVKIPLNSIFYPPCFQWDLALAPQSVRDHSADLFIDLTYDGNDFSHDAVINGNSSVWQDHQIIRVKSWYDFAPMVLMNPGFDAFSKSFPRNTYASAREPQIPSPSTLLIRFLFTPNIETYGNSVTTEFQRLKDEVRQNCPGSRFYGLHLRLRSEFASPEKSFFPCLERLSLFTGDKCYFIASDSDNTTATVTPHLPPSGRLLFLNIPRERNTAQGLQAAMVELYILSSSFMIFGFSYSSFVGVAATIQGIPMNEQHCYPADSTVRSIVCNTPNLVRKFVAKAINNVADNEFDQRKRLGCVLSDRHPPKDANNVVIYERKKQPVVKACLVYVVTDVSIIDSLLVSLRSLEGYFFGTIKQMYRIIVFTQNISEDQLKPLAEVREKMDVAVVELGPWIQPLSLDMDSLKGKDDASINRSHLNRFLSGPLFKHPELKGYDYIMRLDTAAYLCSPASADPFQLMVSRGLNYASLHQHVADHLPMTGLDGLTKSFLQDNGIRPINMHHNLNASGHLAPYRYSDAYEVIRLEFFLHSKYNDYFEALDKANGFFTEGWDEAVIRHLALKLFANQASVSGEYENIIKYDKYCPK
jgi:Glycolipid 2-alpha-mannosyltransferase